MTKYAGIEWVNDYRAAYPYLGNSSLNAQGFLTALLGSNPGAPNFAYGDATGAGRARGKQLEQDQRQLAEEDFGGIVPDEFEGLEGEDTQFAEKVDILYFSGHGKYDRLLFINTTLDDEQAWASEIQMGQEGRLKWFIADACEVLNATLGNVVRRWKGAFCGLHYLLGFHALCGDVGGRGAYFANQLNLNVPIPLAWEIACEETEGHSVPWAYLRAAAPIDGEKWTDQNFATVPFGTAASPIYMYNQPPATAHT